MKIIIYQNREVYKEESKIGNDSENKVETLEFEFPEGYQDFTKYIEFQIKGEKYTDIIENNKYEITRAIAKQGKIKTQIVLRKSIENDVLVFKSNVFELNVSKSINATENIPDEYPTWIDNLTTLKQNLEKSEQERVTSERARVEAETQREETFAQMQKSVEDAVKEIADKKADYNQNALEKTNEYNELTEQKTNAFNSNAEAKTNNFNQNATEKTTAFNTDVSTKTNEFDTNATNKTTEFNNNAKSKTDAFNSNSETKTNAYNSNVETKTNEYNTNAQNKVDEYNANAQEKINEYDEHAEELTNRITTLESENEELQLECKRLREDNQAIAIIGQASGENITLNDSSDARFKKFEIGGNHSQETREGYNKFNYEDFVENVSSTVVSGEAKSFKLSTNSGTYNFKDLKENTSYCVRGRVTSNIVNGSLSLVYSDGSSTTIFEQYDNASIDKTFKINSNASKTLTTLKINIYGNTFITINDFMVYEGTEEKPYEPYGAMPSLEFESPVKTVGQNVNIFDKDNANTLNAIINGTTKQIANFDTCRSIYISCDNNEDYTISRKAGTRFVVGTTTNTPVLNATCNQIVQNNTADSITIKTTESDNYLVVFYYNSGTDTLTEEEIRNSIKVEKGTVATPYSPYGMGSAAIEVCNKNIEDNKFEIGTIDGNTGELKSDNAVLRNKNFIRIKPNQKYMMKAEEYIGIKILNTACRYYDRNKRYLGSKYVGIINESVNNFTITDSNAAFCKFVHLNSEAIPINYTLKIQLEEDIETSYEEHKEQRFVIPIQQETLEGDKFIKQDGKWYEAHYNLKMVLDGTRGWGFGTTKEKTQVFSTTIDRKIISLISNCFVSNGSGDVEKIVTDGSISIYIAINKDRLSELSTKGFQNYLKTKYDEGKPVILYIKVEIPVLIPCVEEQSKILDEIEKTIHSYKFTTHIFSTNELSPIFDVEYAKDTQSYIDNQINKLTTAVVELGGNINV